LGKGLENEAAQDFYKYLFSKEARDIFKAHGFLTTED
jgi:ABC-type molybdate transport system substrate-binding protein